MTIRKQILPKQRNTRLLQTLIAGSSLVYSLSGVGAEIQVNTFADISNESDQLCSLREAVNAAMNNQASGASDGECVAGGEEDRIELQAGRYVLSEGVMSLTSVEKEESDYLTIVGLDSVQDEEHQAVSIIDATELSRIFYIQNRNLTLENLSLHNADSGFGNSNTNDFANGGAIWATGATVHLNTVSLVHNKANNGGGALFAEESEFTIESAQFERNEARYGGGFFLKQSDLILTGSNFSDNQVVDNGGALALEDTEAEIENTVFSENSSDEFGGAITAVESSVDITASEFEENDSANSGAVYLVGGELEIESTQFTENTAGDSGGALFLREGFVEIKTSTFDGNEADDGGAIAFLNTELKIENSTFSANIAEEGGALYTDGGVLQLFHVTMVFNEAFEAAGGIYLSSDNGEFTEIEVVNSIIAGNVSRRMNLDCDGDGDGDYLDAIDFEDHNLVTIASGCIEADETDTLTIAADQVDISLVSELAENEGVTNTHALLAESIAIDVVTSGTTLFVDQRGVERGDLLADLGAYEFQQPNEQEPSMDGGVEGEGSSNSDGGGGSFGFFVLGLLSVLLLRNRPIV